VAHEIREDLGEGEPVVHEKSYLFLEGSLEPAAHRDTDALANDDRSGGWFHYVNDPIGTPEHIVDAEGRIACDIERRVWGETKTSTGSRTDTALRFQGQYSDDETGLTYNRARYYDPQSGRYISADPIGLSGGLNAFAYVYNPIQECDPFGLSTTRTGVKRQNAADWRRTRDLWDQTGSGGALSDDNRKRICKGRTPVVDKEWVSHFPGDQALMGEQIRMHHIAGSPITVPLPESRHMDAHMPGGFAGNPGGPGMSG
jgi:RHS repeat-associated protein